MAVAETLIPKKRDVYTYRCKNCGWECRKIIIPGSSVPITKKSSYGNEATPEPETFADEMYEAATISFTAISGTTPAYLSDSVAQFKENGFKSGMPIRIKTTSGTNDGDYTIRASGVSTSEILLTGSLTTEDASGAGTVTISRVLYKPKVTSGCPMCGSLNSQ